MRRLLLLGLLIPFFVVRVGAQTIDTLWTVSYNGAANGDDELVAMAVDSDNNVILTGTSDGVGSFEDICTVKYSPDGSLLWEARYSEPGFSLDWARAIAVDDSDNVVVVGSVYSDTTQRDIMILKYSPDGQMLWKARFDGELHSFDWPMDVLVDSVGNIYVTGSTRYSFQDFLMLKYDRHGQLLWASRLDGPFHGDDGGNTLAFHPGGGIVAAGYMSYVNEDYNFFTVKYDPQGNIIWYAVLNGPADWTDEIWDVTCDANGFIYVTGESHGQGTDRDFLTVKYAPDGTFIWSARYNGSGNGFDSASKIAVDDSGYVYVSGKSYGGYNNGYDWATIKYDSSGNQLWLYQMNSVGHMEDVPTDMLLDRQGRLWVTGYGFGEYDDFFTFCFDSHGSPIWQLNYNHTSSSNDQARAIARDADGNIIVAGITEDIVGNENYLIIKYGIPPVAIDRVNGNKISGFDLFPNYPNPFNSETSLKFRIARAGEVFLGIYNVRGQLVRVLQKGNLPVGQYTRRWDGRDGNGISCASGLYMAVLRSKGFVKVVKMLLIN
ncbi:MAG: hypothetical protein Kow0037_29870 [Calditrichia bacterium]